MPNETATIGLATSDYLVLLGYLCVVVGLGFWFSQGKKDTESYLLGSRRLPWWAVGASLFVSVTSTLSLVGVPGEVYHNGLTMVIQQLVSPIFALITFFIFVRFFFRTHIFTPFSYLAERFDGRVRGLSAGIVSLTRLFYLGLVLYSSAKIFEGSAGWDITYTIFLVGVIAILYTTLGGIQAVIWVDTLQFLIMAGGLAILVVKLIAVTPGGFAGIFTYAQEHNHLVTKTDESFFGLSPYIRLTFWLLMMQSIVVWTFNHSSDQISIQRMLSTSSYKQAKKALFAELLIDMPMMLSMYFIGLALWVFYQHQSAQPDADLALFHFVTHQLPSPVPGLIVAAMLAAVLSTLDSGINALATIFTKDFYQPLINSAASEAAQVRFAKIMTLLTGLFAIAMALAIARIAESAKDKIMETAFIWMASQSIVPGVFILAVFSRRATATHALIALAAGATTVFGLTAWYFAEKFSGAETISPFYIGAAGLIVTTLVGFLAASVAPAAQSRDE